LVLQGTLGPLMLLELSGAPRLELPPWNLDEVFRSRNHYMNMIRSTAYGMKLPPSDRAVGGDCFRNGHALFVVQGYGIVCHP
jgi:hypothetical protein